MLLGLWLIGGGVAAGFFGSLLGLGGGTLIVPLLTLVFNLPLLTAVGVSLICVIVTSGASAGVFLERHVANLRLGMTLELFTAIGALIGGLVAFLLPERALEGLFAVLLVYTSLSMARRGRVAGGPEEETVVDGEPPDDTFFDANLSGPTYRVRRVPAGAAGSVGAGVVSALLGIGGGIVKVPVMHLVMGVPLRVATATSNLMMGITASAGAFIYLSRGLIDPFVASPTALGVFVGASLGSRVVHRIDLRILRGLFIAILLYTALQMLLRALS
ncbi:MAG TPA: sulfite exporter TauE/SafE family protein [Candidatus Limnocylindrales bacterium]|nr:sulfite exporter TauE/SafE family protein [Candidatus Limnocylindrales bacterium]